MKRFEVSMNILNKEYMDNLIVALVRQGHEVYYNEDENKVCYIADKEELIEIK